MLIDKKNLELQNLYNGRNKKLSKFPEFSDQETL